ncbi:hypothetical protein CEUSTIGMA_g1209.t1 [Chlamydomonas eustigma]|uniref:Uncharacterized protein n=1 Tax=Chlamydomonas eustigma TaxID=1157962 RepID=A0A250WSF1_9CHLO|nr:hypothetical protein CEUSTIGMA_g1209.t1 [Chlamydomonas eustigma]|eukprot:GAX73758.1 hypothetical protein CEUSTIGMA_g1209.t1 [Chlamydomonas eustigma]
MPCPFGYKAEPSDPAEHEEEANASDADAENSDTALEGASEERLQAKGVDGINGDFEKDPVSWFYQNQIKSEADFQARKKELQEQAKLRLENIMKAKKKLLEFDSDFDGSMHSSELSELDSDVHSLSSLKSCAESWIEDADYKTPAEGWLKFSAPAAVAVAVYFAYQSYLMISICGKVTGILLNTQWPLYCIGLAVLMIIFCGTMYLAASTRSKRILLTSEIGLLVTYALCIALIAALVAKPIKIDYKLQDAACHKFDNREIGNKLCNAMPKAAKEVATALPALLWSSVSVGASTIILGALGIWYTFELAYIEKKAAKHKRRHRRRKLSIPWHKIKVIGPVTNCGKGGAPHGAAAKGKKPGKCPMNFS